MAELFYKGEDIALTLDVFSDEAMNNKIALTGATIEVIAYTSEDGYIITASNDEDDETALDITTSDNLTFSLDIPAEKTKLLDSGMLTIEMKIVDSEGTTRINVVNPGITISKSKIDEL